MFTSSADTARTDLVYTLHLPFNNDNPSCQPSLTRYRPRGDRCPRYYLTRDDPLPDGKIGMTIKTMRVFASAARWLRSIQRAFEAFDARELLLLYDRGISVQVEAAARHGKRA